MIDITQTGLTQAQTLASMVRVIKAQSLGESDPLALVSNATAIMAAYLKDINWVGFYILRGGELVLGPFQGKPACSRIKLGEGVCGHSAQSGEAQVVPDVDAFPGHIACDSASRSEVVVPVFHEGAVIAVLDCDSPSLDRFSQAEAEALSEVAAALAAQVAALR